MHLNRWFVSCWPWVVARLTAMTERMFIYCLFGVPHLALGGWWIVIVAVPKGMIFLGPLTGLTEFVIPFLGSKGVLVHVMLFKCWLCAWRSFVESKTKAAFSTRRVMNFNRCFIFLLGVAPLLSLAHYSLCGLVTKGLRCGTCVTHCLSWHFTIITVICLFLIGWLVSLNLIFILLLVRVRALTGIRIAIPTNGPLRVAAYIPRS